MAAQHQRLLRLIPNGHLHLALGAAFVSCSIVALTIPIAGSHEASSHFQDVVSDDLAVQSGWVAQHSGTGTLDARPALQLRTEPVMFTLHEDGMTTTHTATGATVGDALGEIGIAINASDIVTPAASTPLAPGMHIFARYATRMVVRIGGQETTLYTQAGNVGDALKAAGLIEDTDFVVPDRDTKVKAGLSVNLTTVRQKNISDDSPLPHETVYTYDVSIDRGSQKVTQAGSDGYVRKDYSVREINGVEIDRQPLGETTVEPTTEVIVIGTKEPTPAPAQNAGTTPDGSQCVRTQSVWSTYYTAASAGGNRTATGTGVYKGIVAVDPRYIPLGTRMYIPGYGYAIAADTGGGVKGWWVDVAFGDGDAYDWYSHYVDVCILG